METVSDSFSSVRCDIALFCQNGKTYNGVKVKGKVGVKRVIDVGESLKV